MSCWCAATFRSLEASYQTLLQKHADAGVREREVRSQMTALQAELRRSSREKQGLELQVQELQREVGTAKGHRRDAKGFQAASFWSLWGGCWADGSWASMN